MADATLTAPAAPDLGSPAGQAEGVLTSQKDRPQQLRQAVAEHDQSQATAGEREMKQLGNLQGERDRLTPPKLEVPPPPVAKSSDPQQVWSSMAMGLAALGSLMTRTPLTTAMNAAGDVITAYRNKDQAAADQAFQTWKVASDNAVQMGNFQQKAYDEAMSGIEHREKMTIDQKAQADREADAKLRGVLTAFGDETGLARLQEGGWRSLAQLQNQRQQWAHKFEMEMPKLMEQQAFMKAATAMMADPRFQELQQNDPVEAYRALEKLKTSVAPSMLHMTPQQKLAGAEKIQADLRTKPVYKAWQSAHMSMADLDAVKAGLKNGSISQAAIADQFTQIFNGGRAIRGFQMQMNTEHGSLWNKAEVAANQLANGGPLAQSQIDDMITAAKITVNTLNRDMAATVAAAQARAAHEGLDPHDVVPDDYAGYIHEHPDNNPHKISAPKPPAGQKAPSPEHLQYLKAHPDKQTRDYFDETYGAGAAKRALGN